MQVTKDLGKKRLMAVYTKEQVNKSLRLLNKNIVPCVQIQMDLDGEDGIFNGITGFHILAGAKFAMREAPVRFTHFVEAFGFDFLAQTYAKKVGYNVWYS